MRHTMQAPINAGWIVMWDTGETVNVFGEEKARRGDYYAKTKAEANRKAEELKAAGFKNVTVNEGLF